MLSKNRIFALILCLALLAACAPTASFGPKTITYPKIDRHPPALDERRSELTALPSFNPNSEATWQVDLRSYDLSALDLRNSLDDLLYADFNQRTIWPPADKMPAGFDWQKIMELGKNPGLGIRKLHEQGITGKGVGVAIIDQELLVEHQEYAERVRFYEEIGAGKTPSTLAAMHAAAVASLAVGKTVGVAPGADLYFISAFSGKCFDTPEMYHCLAQGIRRILEINQQLPAERKIRVISISRGHMPNEEGSDDWETAIQEANKAGIWVVYSNSGLLGLGRAPLSDPDAIQAYEPGLFWAEDFYAHPAYGEFLLAPMDSRTTASPTGKDEYVFYRTGGLSWAIPYMAGMYALAAQVDPAITPDKFWKTALETGQTIEITHEGKTYKLGTILDPAALITALK